MPMDDTTNKRRPGLHVVTGAFGFSGRRITRRLLDLGHRVRTLTNHAIEGDPLSRKIEIAPLCFDDPQRLTESLRGTAVLYNTYWVRFTRYETSHEQAVRNSAVLIRCAADAGVRRFVHISITNPDEESPLPYFSGKALLEATIRASGLSYAILRPTVLFGTGDILLNNIAWMLRRLPVFGVFGKGDYRLQPVDVDDLASLAISTGTGNENTVIDAVGPEVFSFDELVHTLRQAVGSRTVIVHMPLWAGLAVGGLLGRLLGDVVITKDEVDGLMADLLISHAPPTCPTRLTEWLACHGDDLGRRYASELARHYR
jgi:NADH dehydrogenase